MATTRKTLTSFFEIVSTGAVYIQIKGDMTVQYHIGVIAPPENTVDTHTEKNDISYPGTENIYMRIIQNYSPTAFIIVTEVV